MIPIGDTLSAWLIPWMHLAEGGTWPVWFIMLALALTTLLLEDVAIAAGVALVTNGNISWELAFIAVAGGIAAGDVGLYGLGWLARRVPRLHGRLMQGRAQQGARWVDNQLADHLPSAIFLARVIPGLRLVTYTACGFFKVSPLAFTAWCCAAVSLWTAGLFWLSAALGGLIALRLGIPLALAAALPIVVIALAFACWRYLKRIL